LSHNSKLSRLMVVFDSMEEMESVPGIEPGPGDVFDPKLPSEPPQSPVLPLDDTDYH
jgi:hypothetical protein